MLKGLLVILLLVLGCEPVEAQVLTLKLAHIYGPGNIWNETASAYAAAVERRSAGRIRIHIAPGGMTGDWPASIEALRIGTNDIVLQSVGTLDRYHPLAAIEAYPYLVRDLEHFKRLYHGPLGRELFDEISRKTTFRIIGAGYRGGRHLSSNRPVHKLTDLEGLKLRVPPLKMYRVTWQLLGASPIPMGAAELYTSLQQGIVDGQENPLEAIEGHRFNEVQKYLTETGHVVGAMTWIFSAKRFDSLPADLRTILREEGEAALRAATDGMVALEGAIKARLQARGMIFLPIDTAPLRARLVPLQREFPEFDAWVRRIQDID